MGFGDLMQWLDSSQKTGALIVEGEKYTKKLYFRHGNLLAAASDNPREMLGYYLVGWGYCAEEDLRHMIEMQDHFGVMLGELVVKMNHMTKDELDEVLLVKTKETIYDLLGWAKGDFRFIDDELPGRDFLEVSLPVAAFLFEGFRQRDERVRMREAVPSPFHVPTIIGQSHIMSSDDVVILGAIDGRLNVEQIALLLRLPEFQVLKFIYKCVTEGEVRVDPPQEDNSLVPGQSDAPWLETVREIDDRIKRNRLLDALKMINKIRRKYSGDEHAQAYVAKIKEDLNQYLDHLKIDGSGILESSVKLDELVNLDCEPAEGFILSRINGIYSVGEVLKQLPGSMLHNRVIIQNLLRRGLIKIREQTGLANLREPVPEPLIAGGVNELDDPFKLD